MHLRDIPTMLNKTGEGETSIGPIINTFVKKNVSNQGLKKT